MKIEKGLSDPAGQRALSPVPEDDPRAAEARAERLDALNRLSRGIAHDFNNVLHVINSALEIVSKRLGSPSPEVAHYLDMAKRNAERGAVLTHRLLAFSGGQALAATRMDVTELIASISDEVRRMLGDAAVVDTELHCRDSDVSVDRAQLQAAIVEVACNARDAMTSKGRLRIEAVETRVDKDDTAQAAPLRPGDYVAITIRDNGAGMTPEVLARACEPYFTTKQGGRGKGTGLSQVYGFAKQSGGHLELRSEPGRGTAVTLFLPRLSKGTAHPRATERGPASTNLAGLRVLMIEDEMLVGILVQDLLEDLGCEVVASASSVEEALELVGRESPDLALLDVDLQGKPVYPVARALIERGVPFVFMSGGGHLDKRWNGCPMVQKPIQPAQMEHEIQRALASAERETT